MSESVQHPHSEDGTLNGSSASGTPARRRWWPWVVLAGAVGIAALGEALSVWSAHRVNYTTLAERPFGVAVIRARRAEYRRDREYVGALSPWLEARLGPQLVSAYVTSVRVRPGDCVHRGDVIATLDCSDREAVAERQAQDVRAGAITAGAIEDQLLREQALTSELIARNEIDQHRATTMADRSGVRAARARLSRQRVAVQDCVIRAPFDGDVIIRDVDPGAYVVPGAEVVRLVDRHILRAAAEAPEQDFQFVAPGTLVRVSAATSQRTVVGRIARRAPSANADTRTIHFEVDLENADRSLPADAGAVFSLESAESVAAVEVPLLAADVRGREAEVVLVDSGRAHIAYEDVLGERGGSLFLAPTLPADALIVTEGRLLLRDGDRVDTRDLGSRIALHSGAREAP